MEAEYREPQPTFTGFQSVRRSSRRDVSIDRSTARQSPFGERSFTVARASCDTRHEGNGESELMDIKRPLHTRFHNPEEEGYSSSNRRILTTGRFSKYHSLSKFDTFTTIVSTCLFLLFYNAVILWNFERNRSLF